jgi:hypothetical protein
VIAVGECFVYQHGVPLLFQFEFKFDLVPSSVWKVPGHHSKIGADAVQTLVEKQGFCRKSF